MIGYKREFGENARDINLLLNTIDKVKTFFKMNEKVCGDVAVLSDIYVINGKSLMGLYSLDLSKEVRVVVECKTAAKSEEVIAQYKEALM